MTLPGLRRLLYRSARLAGDAQAVQKGRIGERLANRMIGRTASRVLRRVWR